MTQVVKPIVDIKRKFLYPESQSNAAGKYSKKWIVSNPQNLFLPHPFHIHTIIVR